MTILEFSITMFFVSYVAGLFGALTGLGGAVIVLPVLVLFFKIDIRLAIGASFVAVMTTSSGAALAFMKQNYTNLKVGMLLELGAIVGAIAGAWLVHFLAPALLAFIVGVVLMISAWFSLRRLPDHIMKGPSHPWAMRLGLPGTYLVGTTVTPYGVYRVPLGLSLITFAGALSSLLGIGSGVLRVLAMDIVMGLPYKVSTSTSNFMIGITSATSFGIYFASGYIDPALVFPIMLGVLLGAWMGSRMLVFFNVRILKILFSVVVFVFALQMIYRSLAGLI